jgi:hypothetical protein
MNLKKQTLKKGSQVTLTLDNYHAFGILDIISEFASTKQASVTLYIFKACG